MKHFLLIALLLISGFAIAQKSGHIDYNKLIQAMPETQTAAEDLKKTQMSLNTKLSDMQKELEAKMQAPKETNEALVKVQDDEINAIKTRMVTFQQTAQELIQKEQNKLFTPIVEKAKKALAEVAKSQGLKYVYEVNDLLYYSDDSIDLMKAVKEKLGIKQ